MASSTLISMMFFLVAITITTAQDDPDQRLEKIYKDCQMNAARLFCMGSKGDATVLGGEGGCLKDKNCEVVIHAVQLDVPLASEETKGHTIMWSLVVPWLRLDAQFYLKPITELRQKVEYPLKSVLYSTTQGRSLYTFSNGTVQGIHVQHDDYPTTFVRHERITVTSTKVTIFTFSSNDVISCKANGYEVDAGKEELIPVISNQFVNPEKVTKNVITKPKTALKLFDEQKVVVTTTMKPTTPTTTSTPLVGGPSTTIGGPSPSVSGHPARQASSLLTLLAIVAIISAML